MSDRIAAYPDVNFLVIVNPNSGPGGMPLPSHDYIREVPKLNAFPNVHTVGYIRIDYCKQPLEQSFHDIKLYADWKKHHDIPGLFVRGIYVDETPNHVSRERGQYLDALREYIKASEDLGDRLVGIIFYLLTPFSIPLLIPPPFMPICQPAPNSLLYKTGCA